MKKIIIFSFIVAFIFCNNLMSQVPQGIPYQAIARNGQGQPLANTNVKVRFSILDSTATGTAVYVESHNTTTSALGLFIANVGMGNASTGTFNTINWGQNYKFLKVELDTTATGNSYIDLGTQQMMSVPYALYAGMAETLMQDNILGSSDIFSKSHGYFNVQSDTLIVFKKPILLSIKIGGGSGGNGGGGGNGQQFQLVGGSGGLGGYASFSIVMQPSDTLNLKIGSNGLSGCSYCNPNPSCSIIGGYSGTNGTESIISINSNDHSDFLLKCTPGTAGGGAYCNYVGWCPCFSGSNGINGSVVLGNNFDSKGALFLNTSIGTAQIYLQW